jgi:hypothetical protein
VYPGGAAVGDNARVAVRAQNNTNVFSMLLGAPGPGATGEFLPSINLTDVGGVPTDVQFVHTDAMTNGGLRIAALVPVHTSAVLIDPDTSVTTTVKLPGAYSALSLVTGEVTSSGASGVDVALLWGALDAPSSGVALWTLGTSVGQPYFSVQGLPVPQAIATVDAVPAPNDMKRILEVPTGSEFFVLDLAMRTAAPLSTAGQVTVNVAPDGKRVWAFRPGGTGLAQIDLGTLSPVPLTTEEPIASVFDIARTDGSGRSLVALHSIGTVGDTVFDAVAPDPTTAVRASAILLEGP